MLSKEKIDRINELAKRQKSTGLTAEEEEEQHALRQEYLSKFRSSFKNQLENVKVVDEEGTDVTPNKLERVKRRNRSFRH
ncbi:MULTISPECIES: DUF896 domain-containing protein [Marinococcus]|jgi:uncharacterized protein YnzC (UPF0291/DUF896 family)|uniref:DUF896 domain-containing protein n=1 Tax=Marinococcus TaxID=1370 RepID=UPI0009A89FEE|nr:MULTISPECIES: DUF896 domain-containing protein [Marinococcus]MDX6152863.1 DUF896 domain-containing protein [Marinococcus sp. PL1-022]